MANKPSHSVGGSGQTAETDRPEARGKQAQQSARNAKRVTGSHDVEEIAKGLAAILADTYVTYFIAQTAHWNVEGENFYAFHKLFEEQYEQLADALDDIAEQVRSIGYQTPGSIEELTRVSKVRQVAEARGDREFVRELLEAHEATISRVREILPLTTGELHAGTNDLLVRRVRAHEKAMWMLRATLGEQGRLAA